MGADVIVTRATDAPTHSMAPGEQTRFLLSGGDEMPDVVDEAFGRGEGPPLHRHPWATWMVVVEGRLRVVAGEEDVELAAGDLCYTAPDVPHAFVGLTDRVRLVEMNHPGGRFEPIQRDVGAMFREPGGPDMEKIARAAAERGLTILGPPLQLPE